MKFIIIETTNQNDIWEADVYGSDDGFNPSTPKAHLFLSDDLPTDARQVTIGPVLTAVGWAINDAMTDNADDELAIGHATVARNLLRDAPETVEFVVKLDVGGISKDAAIARMADAHSAPRRIPIAA